MENNENERKNLNINENKIEEREVISVNAEGKEENYITRIKNKKGFLGIIGVALLILLKFKSLLIFTIVKLKFVLVFLKLGKFASTLISMILMIVVYAKMYGLVFGIGFVVLLFIHEMGHYISARIIKLDVTLPIFIPFVGAAIRMKEEPKDAVTEAKLAIWGPVLGSLGAFICLIMYFVSGEKFLMALAYSGFVLNLFNLIPVHPLDGGRVASAISPKLWFIGIPVGIITMFIFFNPILILLLILGVVKALDQHRSSDKSYYEVKTSTRWIFALSYFGLMMLLGVGITYIHGIHIAVLI